MDELLIRIMTRLVRVHDELGEVAFSNAANRALVSIARSVQLDAELRAGIPPEDLGPDVVPFPPSRRRPGEHGSTSAWSALRI